jgi:hypothetical protein
MMRFSGLKAVNDEVAQLIAYMGRHPYEGENIVSNAPMTIADVIEEIRFRFSDRAAASVNITVH